MSEESASFMSSDPSVSQPSLLDRPTGDEDNEIDSLPSSQTDSDDVTVSESEYEESDADKEWKESLQQLELLLSMVIVPYMGKYFGRKFAYWGECRIPLMASAAANDRLGWKQFMEWKYPVEIVVTNKAAFKGAGMAEAAASL